MSYRRRLPTTAKIKLLLVASDGQQPIEEAQVLRHWLNSGWIIQKSSQRVTESGFKYLVVLASRHRRRPLPAWPQESEAGEIVSRVHPAENWK